MGSGQHAGVLGIVGCGLAFGIRHWVISQSVSLQKLFGFLLQYVGDLATDSAPDLKTIDKLVV